MTTRRSYEEINLDLLISRSAEVTRTVVTPGGEVNRRFTSRITSSASLAAGQWRVIVRNSGDTADRPLVDQEALDRLRTASSIAFGTTDADGEVVREAVGFGEWSYPLGSPVSVRGTLADGRSFTFPLPDTLDSETIDVVGADVVLVGDVNEAVGNGEVTFAFIALDGESVVTETEVTPIWATRRDFAARDFVTVGPLGQVEVGDTRYIVRKEAEWPSVTDLRTRKALCVPCEG